MLAICRKRGQGDGSQPTRGRRRSCAFSRRGRVASTARRRCRWLTVHLSIIIPAYNEAERIAPFLADLAAYVSTLGEPTEVIVVDDGSTDATARIVEAHQDRFPAL